MARKTTEDFGTDGETPGGTPAGPPIEIPPDRMLDVQRAEDEQRARLKAEDRVERVVPAIRPGTWIYVGLNGVGVRVPFGVKVMLPVSIAALIDTAVEQFYAGQRNGR